MEHSESYFEKQFDRDTLGAIYGDLYPIEDTFALVGQTDVSVVKARELYSDRRRERIIVAPEGSPIASVHDALQATGISLLEKVHINGIIVFPVPKNTRTIESVAALIEDAHQEQHDTAHYMPIFRLLGRELNALQSAGFGAPAASVLQQFAFSPDRQSDFGARVIFLPPYKLTDAHASAEEQLHALRGFLLSGESPVSTEAIVQNIVEEVARGWRER